MPFHLQRSAFEMRSVGVSRGKLLFNWWNIQLVARWSAHLKVAGREKRGGAKTGVSSEPLIHCIIVIIDG